MAFRSQLRRVPVPQRVEQALDAALDTALRIQRPVVLAYIDRLRARHPGITPAELVPMLERRYVAAVAGLGGASGAAAAMPGAGTTAVLASGAAEITAFISASAMYVLALAELHRVPLSDPGLRRALVVAVLVGEGGEALLAGSDVQTSHWAQVLAGTAHSNAREASGMLDARVRPLLLTRFGARQSALLFGRALPLGIGAGIGAAGNATLARAAIAAARKAFGPPPREFPPRVIDIDPRTR
ncbi:MAG TPA: hypothetical protein VFH38_05815 [Jatrophihabitans sp.]|nr:hypothetical protein [Jatrophihabitans sp.]